jgi:hypothetical protein
MESSAKLSREEIASQSLQEQKQSFDRLNYAGGLEAGREFVLNAGQNPETYRRLATLWDFMDYHTLEGSLNGLLQALGETSEDDASPLRKFFKTSYKDCVENPEWIFGFADGAQSAFEDLGDYQPNDDLGCLHCRSREGRVSFQAA